MTIAVETRNRISDVAWVQAAALALGLNTTLAANGTLLVDLYDRSRSVCLSQGVPPATSQATAAFLSDQIATRQVLHGAGVPLPTWRPVPFAHGQRAIAQVAREVGFPLTLRPGWGGRQCVESQLAVEVRKPRDLDDAVQLLQTAAGSRAMRPAQPRGRLIVDRYLQGRVLRLLLLRNEVLDVMHDAATAFVDAEPDLISLNDLHSDLPDLTRRAVSAVPSLGLASVRVVVRDPRLPLSAQQHAVLDVDMFPGLSAFERARPGAGRAHALTVLTDEMGDQGSDSRLASWVRDVTLRIGGLPFPSLSLNRVAKFVSERGLADPSVFVVKDDHLSANLTGDTLDVALICERLIAGAAGRQRPLYVETQSAN